MVRTAFVNIWDTLVGAVAWNEQNGLASFEYDPKFLSYGWDLTPFKMPIENGAKIYSFPELRGNTFKGLPGLLADVLPDRYGNQLIHNWLMHHGRLPESMNPVETLCFIGSRGMGALEFEPSSLKKQKNTFQVEIDGLVRIAQKMLSKQEHFETSVGKDQEKAMLDILKIGTSAGGARPKAIIAFNEKTGEVRSGQTRSPEGFEHWLIKLDGVSDAQFGESSGYGRVEMAYYLMAKDSGIEMQESRLLEENGRAHFMTKRFDREGTQKHHVQTWCALEHFDYNDVFSFSYEQLFQTMRMLRLSYPEMEQMFRRMVFNVMARNCDDHTKNFAFRLKREADWELAPGYDICHAYRPNSQLVSQHAISVNGKRNNIQKKDLLSIAESMYIKRASQMIDQINNVVANWKNYADEVKVNAKLRDAIALTHVLYT